MHGEEEKIVIQGNLRRLRLDSFEIILLLTTVVGWAWFSWAIWPQESHRIFRSNAWSISGTLLVVSVLCYLIKQWNIYLATSLFLIGLVAVITGSFFVFKNAEVAYLYIIPIIFSSILLGQIGVISFVCAIMALGLGANLSIPELALSDFVIPTMTITLTTVAILISSHNLETSLDWTLNSYQQAHKNELIAREHKAQLERVLKSLDSAIANLEGTNVILQQARNQAEEARKLKQQFAQTISHEMRTPLNLIVGFTETMIKSPEYYGDTLPPVYLRDLSVVYRNASHLQNLVNDVLDLARLEAAYLSLEFEELNIGVVIEDAINTARKLVEGHGLALYADIQPNLPDVWGDAVRLKQVLLNLLNNAARFTESGSVTVNAFAQAGEVIVSVSDTGIGIPNECVSQIFESFRQLENPMQRRTEGAGLGLAISKQLIGLHGGHIWVESRVGIGSTFFFSLPVNKVEMLSAEKPLENSAVALPDRQQRAVLLVTRSPSVAALLSRHLSGYRTVAVSEIEQARVAARQLLPQVLIIDTSTEDMPDTELSAFIQSLDLPRMNVITCPLPGEEPLRKRLSADGYLIKPIAREALWDILRQFCNDLTKVLVVDDDRDFVRLLTRMLSSPVRQYHIMYAHSGHEALELIKISKPEIMLLDINLPDIDGIQVIQTIRANPDFSSIRIVVITAYEELDSTNLINGSISVTKTSGMAPTEIMQWLHCALDHSPEAPSREPK